MVNSGIKLSRLFIFLHLIVCEQVPPQALNKKVLEKHFSKFGKVTKVTINLKKASAAIHFEDHKSAFAKSISNTIMFLKCEFEKAISGLAIMT